MQHNVALEFVKPSRSRRISLLAALAIVAGASVFVRISWERQRARDLTSLSVSELRVYSQQQPRSPELHTALAERYLAEERNEDALREANLATRLDSKSSKAFYCLGKAFQRAGESQRALSALNTAVELDPNNVRARFLLGHGCFWGEQPLLAAKHFEAYVEKQPGDDIGFRFLGMSRMRLGNFQAAEPALKRAVQLGGESSANHKAMGDFYLARSNGNADLASAAAEFKRTLEINPLAWDVHVLLGQVNERLNRPEDAAMEYKTYLAHFPTDPKTCFALGRLYRQMKKSQEASYYQEMFTRILRAREASQAVTARGAGEPSNPLQ